MCFLSAIYLILTNMIKSIFDIIQIVYKPLRDESCLYNSPRVR